MDSITHVKSIEKLETGMRRRGALYLYGK